MMRVPLYRALRALNHSGVPKQNGLNVVPRSTTSRSFGFCARPLSRATVLSPQSLRRNSSVSEVLAKDVKALPEEDVNALLEEDIDAPGSPPPLSSPVKKADPSDLVEEVPIARGVTKGFGKWWLRDNCQCSMCVHPDTRQRIVDTFSIPKDISVVKTKGVQDGVELTWSDGHVSFHPYEYLKNQSRHSNRLGVRKRPKATAILRKFKTQSPSNPISPTVSYSSVMSEDTGVLRWLENVYTWGFCFVEDTPVDPESTEALLKRIAFIRHTHYGGFWDFTADLTFKDTAYTTEPLGAHTDNTYFTDPSRLQLFHLLSHTEGEGGASLLVDGFQATQTLQKENKEHAITLQSTKHSYHSSGNADIVIQPLIQKTVLGVRSYRGPIMQQIRWNNYDRVVKMDWKLDEQQAWYEAASHFNEIIRRPEMEIWTQLKPGTALLFDNWRMLHGRSEFTGKRRMCGGYINNDDFISRFRVLKFGRDCMIKNFGNMVMHKQNPYSYF